MSCCNCAASSASPDPPSQPKSLWPWLLTGGLLLFGGLTMTLSLAVNLTPASGASRGVIHGFLAVFSGLALMFAGAPIFRKALTPRITLEQLFLLGLLGSYAASVYSSATGVGHIYYEVVVILLGIYHFGQLITRVQVQRLERLENEVPGLRGMARLYGQDSEVPVAAVQVGDVLEVRPGEVNPADGMVERGEAFVERLVHTGEFFPTAIHPGETLLAGCRVLDGTLLLRATSPGCDREVDRLFASCEGTPMRSAESLAGAVLRFFVPAVVIIALVTILVWLARGETSRAFFNGLAVTIVACPCGIGLAVPLALRRGNTRLRLLGFVPHVPDFLERLAAVDTVAFDKTGTLTSPNLAIRSIETTPDSPPELMTWIAAIQQQSTHPVARPFWKLAAAADLDDLVVTALPARGIRASFKVAGHPHELVICNSLSLEGQAPQTAPPERTLHLSLDGQPVGKVAFQEDSRDGALLALRELSTTGYRTELLTGDAGVPSELCELVLCHTGLTAAEKASHVRALQEKGGEVLVVGDGLNDTEAMTAAHVSLALGPEARAASSVASATLSHHDLTVLPRALQLSSRLARNMTRLLAFTLIYNFLGITLACLGVLHPIHAALLMLASSATVLFMAGRDSWKGAKAPERTSQGVSV